MPGSSTGPGFARSPRPQTSLSHLSSRIPRRCPIPSNSPPKAITNTSAPVQPTQAVTFQQPANAQFQDAENVTVNGGHFTNARGHHVVSNVIINLLQQTENGGEDPAPIIQPISIDKDDNILDEVTTTEPKSMPSGDGDAISLGSNSIPRSSFETKTCNEIYEALLAPKRRGYALWIPEPNKNIPFPYQRKGVQIGDVGIITPDGSFSFIFNVCVSRDDPVNPRSLPEEFAPIHPPIDPIDIRRFAVFKAGSYLASTSIEKFQDDTTSPGLSFRASASEGAILTIPEGAISQDLLNIRKFREYASANVKRWYRYINGPRGREAKNGDVRLVVGCDKATSWGMATLSNMTQDSQLKFKPLSTQSSGYTWEYSGMAEVRVGPDQEEIDELRREDPADPTSRDKYLNQCLFVRTLNVAFNDDDWESFNHGVGTGYTLNSVQGHGAGTPPSLPSNRGAPSDSTSSASSTTTSNIGIQRMTGGSPAMEFISLGTTADRLTISAPPNATSCHPSRILNETLLKKFPAAKMVITHDEDWYSCIQEDMTMSSDPEHILASVSTLNDIRQENGVIYLEPKVSRALGRTDTTQSSGGTSSNATHSSTFSQDGSDFYPPASNSPSIGPTYFSNNEGDEISAGEFIDSAGDSKVKYFSNPKNMKITGGRYGTLGRTDTTQSFGGTLSNATHSSTFSQDGSDYYFSLNNERYRSSGGTFIASAGDSKVKYFSDSKNMKITGGRYGTLGRTDTTQSSGGTSSNATHSSTFSQDGSDGDSHPSRQSTGKIEAHQQGNRYPDPPVPSQEQAPSSPIPQNRSNTFER